MVASALSPEPKWLEDLPTAAAAAAPDDDDDDGDDYKHATEPGFLHGGLSISCINSSDRKTNRLSDSCLEDRASTTNCIITLAKNFFLNH